MTEWKECKLGDVVFFSNGKSRPDTSGYIPIYGGNGILEYTDQSNNDGETIIIGRVGAYCGSVYYENRPVWVSDNALAAKPKEQYYAKYLYYLLKFSDLNQYAEGSSHPLLTQSLLNSIDIVFCDNIDEQKAIAEVLSSLDDKIDLLTRQNKTLEDLAQAYFRKWFIEDIHNKICYKRFADVAEFSKGKKPREIIEEQRKGYVRQILIDTFDTDKEYYTRPEGMIISTETDILIVMDGASSGRVEIGFSGVVGSTIGMFRPKSDFKYPMFLYEFLKSNEEFIMDNTTGSAIPHADKKLIFELEIPYFQEEKIQEFENFALVLFNKRQNNRRQIRTLTKLRDTLLPKLISGEIRVKM